MADQTNERRNEVKVEDLLRLKRAERPDEAFWGTFDRELHQRMLRTLVKKDPWHVQLLRGLSGRFAQSAAVASAAAVVALIVARPAFTGSQPDETGFAESTETAPASAPQAAVVAEMDAPEVGEHDYRVDSISAESASSEAGFTRDFGMEGFQFAYERSDYSVESVSGLPAFGSTGVASLVY